MNNVFNKRLYDIMRRIPIANEKELDAIGIELNNIEQELMNKIKGGI